MILVIIVIGLVTLLFQYSLYFDSHGSARGKIILSLAILISVWWIILLINQIYFYQRNDLGFSINYDLKDFIFDDHWFLSSLSFSSITFLILLAHEKISRIQRIKLLANETAEERKEREEREAKKERERMMRKQEKLDNYYATQQVSQQKETQELRCPKCSSTNLTANTKGFGLGKAAVGGVLLGPVGLLGGLVGSKKAVFICLHCGNQFQK